MTSEERKQKAYGLMVEGYNCCQATVLAFADLLPESEDQLKKLTSSMGGGVGGMRDICGAVSGMALVIGALSGFSGVEKDKKAQLNKRVQFLAKEFTAKNGSRLCRDLTELTENGIAPIPREDGRNCKDFVGDFVKVVSEYIAENKL
jgi:C_GCAxxG_C_C family probable redox protein